MSLPVLPAKRRLCNAAFCFTRCYGAALVNHQSGCGTQIATDDMLTNCFAGYRFVLRVGCYCSLA